jgi:DNA-binding transcriptional LysR family regulator
MDIDSLRSFIAFVDTGSFTRAAKQTFRSQSAISMQMKKLESDTGKILFAKKGRNLALTTDGRVLVSYARRILALHDQALSNFADTKNNRPVIIGCPEDYLTSALDPLLALIKEKNPQQQFRVHCENTVLLRHMLDKGEVDLAILTRSPESEEGYLLKHDQAVWFDNGHYYHKHLSPIAVVTFEEDCKIHAATIDGLEKTEHGYLLAGVSPSASAIKLMVKQGLGIGTMPASALEKTFRIINDVALPQLPAIDIVLAVTPIPHPIFSAKVVATLSKKFMQLTANQDIQNQQMNNL